MAAALFQPRNDPGPAISNAFQQALMTDLDFRDTRYPSVNATPPRPLPSPVSQDGRAISSAEQSPPPASSSSNPPLPNSARPNSRAESEGQSVQSQPQSQEPSRSVLSYSLPPATNRRVLERYSLEDNTQTPTLVDPEEQSPPTNVFGSPDQAQNVIVESPTRMTLAPEIVPSLQPSSPRHPSLPAAGIGTNPSTTNTGFPPPIVPSSASPSYIAPVSARHRAYPQQPTFVSQNAVPNPVFSTAPPQLPEEVCVECAMRDQDMADVDVTSPGIWERESDALFEGLKRREEEEQATGVINNDPSRPRSKGGMLTEQNLKIWLSVNPREPASRQQTLYTYLKSQRALLEAEALAHARAAQEARNLDSRMRDTYSRLRTSAYDSGASADDLGGVRIRPPRSPSSPSMDERSHSRDVTLLENGMIIEHVDVRKEEKEARERRRKEERRMRKSSRGSGMDGMSTISLTPMTDSGVGLGSGMRPYSHYSYPSSGGRPGSSGGRPGSVFSDRPELPRAQSQASFTDMRSLGSASPRRSRFLGIGNFRDRWRSQDSLAPSGISGSMVDMHVALQRESYLPQHVDLGTLRQSQIWPTTPLEPTESRQSQADSKSKKKKKGFAKIWGMVTGSSKRESAGAKYEEPLSMSEKHEKAGEDDGPLAPPPPLSYLVNHRHGGARHTSTPSLVSPKLGSPGSPGMSPPSAPSSILPSPSSSRPSNSDLDFTIRVRNGSGNYEDENDEDTIGKSQGIIQQKSQVHLVTSEPDMRAHWEQQPKSPLPLPNVTNLPASREKSLPPLPPEAPTPVQPQLSFQDARPRTVYTFDNQGLPPGSAPAHDFLPPQAAFRAGDGRRQSFGGLTSRPNIGAVLSPQTNDNAFYNQGNASFGPRYDELGYSRRSLVLLSNDRPMTPTTKRKSKFTFSSLLGRKSPQPETIHQFPTLRHSGGSDTPEELMTNGYATSTYSALSQAPRTSIISRKPLEELVTQDSDFVAYRYPSNDQRLDLR